MRARRRSSWKRCRIGSPAGSAVVHLCRAAAAIDPGAGPERRLVRVEPPGKGASRHYGGATSPTLLGREGNFGSRHGQTKKRSLQLAGSSAAAQDFLAEPDREAIEREQFDEPTVLGLIPKHIFETGILYEIGPTFAKDLALAHDGSVYGEPLTVRDWRQTVFELDRNKLHYDALPDYINYLERAEGYRWDHAADNREVILISDVEFEWLPDGLEANPGLRRDSEGNYRPMDPTASGLFIGKDRFFGAALLKPVLYDRLVTFALVEDFVYSNLDDPINNIDIKIDGRSFSIPLEGTQPIDLGDAEGKKIVHLVANHDSGTKSYAAFQFELERLPSGHWANTTERADVTEESASRAATANAGGALDFTIRHLPPVVFTTDPNVD